jgi:hypothetical protein
MPILVHQELRPNKTLENSAVFVSAQFPFNTQKGNKRALITLNFAKCMARTNAQACQCSEAFHQTARAHPWQKLHLFQLTRILIRVNRPNPRNIAISSESFHQKIPWHAQHNDDSLFFFSRENAEDGEGRG